MSFGDGFFPERPSSPCLYSSLFMRFLVVILALSHTFQTKTSSHLGQRTCLLYDLTDIWYNWTFVFKIVWTREPCGKLEPRNFCLSFLQPSWYSTSLHFLCWHTVSVVCLWCCIETHPQVIQHVTQMFCLTSSSLANKFVTLSGFSKGTVIRF